MSGSTRDGILSEIALSVKQNEVLHYVKWAELSEVLYLEGIQVSSGSKRTRRAVREQTVLKHCGLQLVAIYRFDLFL